VRLLGLIGGRSAADVLRAVLRRHDLAVISPVLAQSEYAVKDEAVVQLLHLGRDDLADEVLGAFRRDRLPAAMEALARWRVTAVIPDLVAALEDDILADRACDALRQFGASAEEELARTLAVRRGEAAAGGESRVSLGRRVLAALLLGRIGSAASVGPLRALLLAPNPVLKAAAAVALHALHRAHPSAERCRAIINGGLSSEWRVRERCQEAARAIGAPCVPAAIDALGTTTIADLYGAPRPLEVREKSWLIALIVERAPHGMEQAETALFACDAPLLVEGLALVREREAVPWVVRLKGHPDQFVRGMVARTLGRLGGAPAAVALPVLVSDRVRDVRTAAARAIRALVAAEPGLAPVIVTAGRRSDSRLLRLRLRWVLRGSGGIGGRVAV
jgi:hypothetical protein